MKKEFYNNFVCYIMFNFLDVDVLNCNKWF